MDGAVVAQTTGAIIARGDDDVRLQTSGAYTDGAWHHVVATWDKVANVVELHLDGGAIAGGESVNTPHIGNVFPFSSRHRIGKAYHTRGSGLRLWGGLLDEAAIWNRAISEGEAALHGEASQHVMEVDPCLHGVPGIQVGGRGTKLHCDDRLAAGQLPDQGGFGARSHGLPPGLRPSREAVPAGRRDGWSVDGNADLLRRGSLSGTTKW